MTIATTEASGRLSVEVAKDLMSATVHLEAVKDQAPPTPDEVAAAVEMERIPLDDAVKSRIDEFIRLVSDGEAPREPFVVSKGRPPVEGRDEAFVWDPRFEEEATCRQGDVRVNHYSASSIVTVEKDAVLGTITPLTQPKSGVNVRGETLKAGNTPQELEIDKTIRREQDTLIADVAGRVVQSGNKLKIDEVLIISGDVDFSTGNVDSTIAVQINGNIPDRFETKSAKSITVGGAIEAAYVEAKENVIVQGGIVGRNTGKVFANEMIIAKFCDEANMTAGGDIKISKQVMNCRVRTGGKLAADGAAIVGGHVWANEGITTGTLGSEACTPTRLFIGICPDMLEEAMLRNRHLQAARAAVEKTKEKLKPFLDKIKRLTPAQRNAATALLRKVKEATTKIHEEEQRSKQLLEDRKALDKPAVHVSGIIHPRVTISIGTRVLMIEHEMRGPVSIELRKVDGATEFVAANPLTSSVTVLKSHKVSTEDLIRDFEPLAHPKPEPDSEQQEVKEARTI